MDIILHNVKPDYMSESEVAGSDIYLQPTVVFEQGRGYMVCAKSGHGKTSLLNFIYGINSHYDGEILFSPVSKGPRTGFLSYVFQDLCLFPELTAMENVLLKNNLTGFKSHGEIERMFDALLLSEKKDTVLRKLSLGQRQRVAVMRALCQPFAFILLDEPFSHIDRQTAEIAANLISEEAKSQKAGIIVTALDTTDLFDFDISLQL